MYKACISKDTKQIKIFQLRIVKSPLSICLALIQESLSIKSYPNAFSVGYLALFSELSSADACIFFNHLQENGLKKSNNIFGKGKYLAICWLTQVYIQYLHFTNNFSFFRYFKIKKPDVFFNYYSSLRLHGLVISITKSIYCLDIVEILAKLRLVNIYGSNQLINQDFLAECIRYIDLSLYFLVLKRNSLCLTNQLIELLVAYYCYEISIMLSNSTCFGNQIVWDLTIINDTGSLLVLSNNPHQLDAWGRCMTHFLKSNGIRYNRSLFKRNTFLSQGLTFKEYFISLSCTLSPSLFTIRPSLQYQFVLMKTVSYILNPVSKSLFVLVIRLNKILSTWLFFYRFRNSKKIFLLLDYIVQMKFRLFARSKLLSAFSRQIGVKILTRGQRDSIVFVNKTSRVFIANAYNRFYYKQYVLIKLYWLSLLSSHINLREAV